MSSAVVAIFAHGLLFSGTATSPSRVNCLDDRSTAKQSTHPLPEKKYMGPTTQHAAVELLGHSLVHATRIDE